MNTSHRVARATAGPRAPGIAGRSRRSVFLRLRSEVVFSLMFAAVISSSALAEEVKGAAPAWPSFGGSLGEFTAEAEVVAWGAAGPKGLWERPLGAGYSAIVGDGDELFTMFRDGDQDVVVALEAGSGETRWQQRYHAPSREAHLTQFGTGPHATPLLLADRLITLGYSGDLRAFGRSDGAVLWSYDVVEDLGAEVTPWGFSASPILHGGSVIVLLGGDQGAAALDPADGSVRWRSEAGTVSYSTPRVLRVGDREELIFFAKDSLRSLDPASGKTLWHHEVKNGYENHASNLLWDGTMLWVASQQEAAGRVLWLEGEDREPRVVWSNPKVRLHHWNAVLEDGVVYGSLGDSTQVFSAVDLASGEILWRDRTFGLARPLTTAGATLLLNEDGELFLAELKRSGAKVLARATLSDSLSRTIPTLIGSRLYLRDTEKIQAFDLGSGSSVR